MTQRRYTDDEVAAIFEAATEGPRSTALQRGSPDGLTLADLQQIGVQVGLAPDVVAQAAHSLELRPQSASRTFVGVPIGVERSITLDRFLTEREWENLVGELRAVFRATGKVSAAGSFRQWRNGNLIASLEPGEHGHELRLSTVKETARPMMAIGAAMVGSGAVVWASAMLAGHLTTSTLLGAGILGFWGAALVGVYARWLNGWAALRGRQMDSIAARVATTAAALPPGPPPTTE